MKIILIGANGTLGVAVQHALAGQHELVRVGRTQGDFTLDYKDAHQIEQFFEQVGPFDALVSTLGQVHFAPFEKMTAELYQVGLQDKLMGQVNLVLIGRKYINDEGSFTLTSGVLAHDPIVAGTSASMVNGAIESFVQAAAIEMPRGLRINAVSPTVIIESLSKIGGYFPGFEPIPSERAAFGYIKSIRGRQTGQIYRIT